MRGLTPKLRPLWKVIRFWSSHWQMWRKWTRSFPYFLSSLPYRDTKMAKRFRQFRLLLWKNFILQVSKGDRLKQLLARSSFWKPLFLSDSSPRRNSVRNRSSSSSDMYSHYTEVSTIIAHRVQYYGWYGMVLRIISTVKRKPAWVSSLQARELWICQHCSHSHRKPIYP